MKENERIWNERSENGDRWALPVSSEEVERARQGEWSIVLTPAKPVPRSWFPADLTGAKVLCLASGGGQRGPILAAARDGLAIRTVQGNMQDLSAFADESFDCIVHPASNGYISNVRPVWMECARILKKGGILMAGFGNPVESLFSAPKLEKGILEVANRIPYADIEHTDDEELMEIVRNDGFIWSHTLEDQIQGQIEAGFAIVGFYEDIGGTCLDQYMNSMIATKAIKL